MVEAQADAILECGYECWISLADSGVVIEFQDGEGFTAGRAPPVTARQPARPPLPGR
ncbi:hypothetical protein [Streptomyces sp. NPDC029041]|uniref:hypothetical protein n=1 Tax=Streptomyces sp. NPDC029041 TaxID=3155727 RepID=UPI0033C8ABC9